MRTARFVNRILLILSCVSGSAYAGELGGEWSVFGKGDWAREKEFRTILRQRADGESSSILSQTLSGATGVWRCRVELSPGTTEAGIRVLAPERPEGGLSCMLGGTGQMRGFLLRGQEEKPIWSDEWAPWTTYEPYLIEAIVEKNRVRVQLLDFSGRILISQSPWIAIEESVGKNGNRFGLVTEKGIARFWGWGKFDSPLMDITPNAPNKRRLVAAKDSPWLIVGPTTWMWTDASKRKLQQTSQAERAWAFNKKIRGTHRTWSCRVKVSAPAGGAGLTFQGSGTGKDGFLCWLGGTYGAGSLMLYELPLKSRWSSPQGKWSYDTEYVLVGETKPGKVRVRMLAADGKTVIAESPWVDASRERTDREGMLGFHTWKGPAEFWAFDKTGKSSSGRPTVATKHSDDLGRGWLGSSDQWAWTERDKNALKHAGTETAAAFEKKAQGAIGRWTVRVTPPVEGTSDLLFQAFLDAKTGFASSLEIKKGRAVFRLIDLSSRTLWSSKPIAHKAGASYILEGIVRLDRVQGRLLAGNGKTVLADSDQIYVSDKNNARVGHLGVRATGPAVFSEWSFQKSR